LKIIQRSDIKEDRGVPDGLHPVLRRIYRSRGISNAEQLDLSLARLYPPDRLTGIDEAARLLHQALERDAHILIVGDYDCDGATSTCLCLLALQAFGGLRISYLVPNRFDYGYGLTPEIVQLAAQRTPDLIVTVDNGIASLGGVERANELGIPVLVTDHHLAGGRLPAAAAIVNPNQPGDSFPSKHLAGVGVVFYILVALRSRLRESGWFRTRGLKEPNLADWLDLVALGTVADLVPLDHNNRILVEQGLRRIRAGRCRPGIRALLEMAGRDLSRVVTTDLGFVVGPRLNAAGRLQDMSLGIECLLTEDISKAQRLAADLDRLNRTRREIEQQMQVQAMESLQRLHMKAAGELPAGLCVYREAWHQGVIGILASRVREQYHRPVIAFARAGDGMLKGSARSIPGLHIRDLLERIAARHEGLLERFGGHAMAAGLSLLEADFERFKRCFEEEAARQLDPDALIGSLLSDGQLAGHELNLELAQQLRYAGPWGQGFPEPLFDGRFRVLQQRVVGERHLKLRLTTTDGAGVHEAIAFNQVDAGTLPDQVHLAYRLDVNEYRGLVQHQLIVENIQSTN
jgi:single-stranded-DNA-specific exonuclease